MNRMPFRRGALTLLAAVPLVVAVATLPPAASAATPPAYQVHRVGPYGGEPSIWSDGRGILWSTYLHGDPNIYRSTDHGTTWKATKSADPNTGDDCVVTDQSNKGIYWCNLGGSPDIHPLEGDVWKSVDDGQTWKFGEGNVPSLAGMSPLGTSSNVFGVDRQWVDTYIAPGGTTDTATAYFFYHDFSAQSNVYVNVSHDGGKTWGAPIDLMTSFDTSAPDYLAVQEASICNTIPTAVRTVKNGAHKGRVYAAWLAADATSLGTGCDFSQFQAFHNLVVAWSDNEGVTWTPRIAFDGGFFHDASSPFAAFTLDDQGNPYNAFVMNRDWDQTCAVGVLQVTAPQTPKCSYDMFVNWSPDAGATWKAPVKVSTDTGTHWFPAIAAGQPGQVDVAWLRTPYVIATDVNGKQHPGGCVPIECGNDVQWDLYASQSVNLAGATPTWATTKVTAKPMHARDICNLGIACPPSVSVQGVRTGANRNLADFISETLDEKGCAHINFSDDLTDKQVSSADQVSGTCLGRVVPFIEAAPVVPPKQPGILPPTSGGPASALWALLLLPPAAAGLAAYELARRRRRSVQH
jgi:hypothetical protein